MTGALFSFSAMAIAGRELSSQLATAQIVFFRSAVGLVLLTLFFGATGWHRIHTRRIAAHVLRNLVHFAAQYGWFVGVALLPLAQVFAIEFTVPLWVLLLARLFLGERLSAARVLAMLLGLVGVLLILRPGLQSVQPASLVVLASAFGFAISTLFVKRLVATESATAIVFYMSFLQAPMGLVLALADWRTPNPALWPWLLVVGLSALTAHFSLSRALAEADAMVVAPMDFLRLPLIAAVGALFYAEPFDPMVIAGGAVMVVGNLLNLRARR